MFNKTNIYVKEEHDTISLVYDRGEFSNGWSIEVIGMENEDTHIGVFRTTLKDGKQCEQFTLLPTKGSDITLVQIRIFKNGDILTYSSGPANIVVYKRKKIVTVELYFDLVFNEENHTCSFEYQDRFFNEL